MIGFFDPNPPSQMYRRPSAGDIFGSVLSFFLIFFVLLIALAYLLFPVFVFFMCIGVALGVFYALVVYIRAFVDACRQVGNVRARNGVTKFIFRWGVLFGKASWFACRDNFNIARNALLRASGYRLLSFKKWMWLLVAPSIMIFGTLLIAAIALLQLFMFAMAAFMIFWLLMLILALLFLGAFIYGVIDTVRNFSYTASRHNNIFTSFDFSKYAAFGELFPIHVKGYFQSLFGYCKDICTENWSQGITNFKSANTYSLFSFWRYFLLLSPVSLNLISALAVILFCVFFFLLFVPMFLANVVWLVIVKIFFR